MLSKEEKFVCTLIWGAIPIDENWIRNTKLFEQSMERFKVDTEWQELYKIRNKRKKQQ